MASSSSNTYGQKPLYYGTAKKSPIYYGSAQTPAYYGGGSAPYYYGGSGGAPGGNEDADSLVGTITLGACCASSRSAGFPYSSSS